MSLSLIRGRRRQTTRQSTLPTDVTRPTNEPEDQPTRLAPIMSEPDDQDTTVPQVVPPTPPVANNDNPTHSPTPAQPNNPLPEPPTSAQPRTTTEPGIKGDKDAEPGNYTKLQGNAADIIQAKFTPAKRSRVWDIYVKKTDDEDKDLVEDWDRIIDVTLVFAALFSAISTGFVLESSKNLKVDHSEATVTAIRDLANIVQAGFNGSAGTSPSGSFVSSGDAFKPTLATVWVNCLWLLSLGLSISVSLFAMLAKRWCYTFRSKRLGTTYERAMKRQKAWDAIEQWKIELVVEQLPTLMHVALMLFFFGLVVYLSEIHQTAMIITAALVGCTLAIYFVLTILPLWYKSCPMVTPFTRIVLAAQYYFVALKKFISPKARSLLQTDLPSLDTIKFFVRPSSWRPCFSFFSSLFQRIFYWIISTLKPSRWLTVLSTKAKQPSVQQPGGSACDTDWVMECCLDPATGKTVPYPTPTENRKYEFRALAWILGNSKDRDSVKEVLDHVAGFPEVILDSLAKGKHLYGIASMAAEHLNRFQHETKDHDSIGTLHFNALCARLMYLTVRPWLHQSTTDGSTYSKIEELYSKYDQSLDPDMTPDELKKQLSTIKKEKINALSDPIPWMEVLARKIVISCSPEPGLKMCNTLGSALLHPDDSIQGASLSDKTYSTLWWIFLNNVMDCTENRWPYDVHRNEPRSEPAHGMTVNSDSLLTLSHFSELQKRQESYLWLAVVSISGMLYAFSHYPDHEASPQAGQNDSYFKTLIGVLRSVLRTPLYYPSPDPFVGELPVHSGTEIRLYQFDSLEYASDALRFALSSRAYRGVTFLNDLCSLLDDINQLKVLKKMFSSAADQGITCALVEEGLRSQVRLNHAPDIWMSAGLRHYMPGRWGYLSREQAEILSRVLPDIIFGTHNIDPSHSPSNGSSSSDSSSNHPSPFVSAAHTFVMSDSFIVASDDFTRLAWMPFSYDTEAFRTNLKAKNPKSMSARGIWPLLDSPELLFMCLDDAGQPLLGRADWRSSWPLKHCLLIKASLLERLYSFPHSDPCRPDTLTWSIALSKQIVVLLGHWDHKNMDVAEETRIVTSFKQLINALFDAPVLCCSPDPEPPSLSQPSRLSHNSPGDRVVAQKQLKSLVDSGILPVLSRPLSDRHGSRTTSRVTPRPNEWYDSLALTIERLVREFCYPHIDQSQLSSDPNHDGGFPHGRGDSGKFYADLVTYYQAQVLENEETYSPMLDRVRRLRDDAMGDQPTTASPNQSVIAIHDSPAHVEIDLGSDGQDV